MTIVNTQKKNNGELVRVDSLEKDEYFVFNDILHVVVNDYYTGSINLYYNIDEGGIEPYNNDIMVSKVKSINLTYEV